MAEKGDTEIVAEKEHLTLGFAEADTVLLVAVKIPGEKPRVLPLTIEDVRAFLEEEFNDFWAKTKERVQNELVRGIV